MERLKDSFRLGDDEMMLNAGIKKTSTRRNRLFLKQGI